MREIKDIMQELDDIKDRLMGIYEELCEADAPEIAGHVMGATSQIRRAKICTWDRGVKR